MLREEMMMRERRRGCTCCAVLCVVRSLLPIGREMLREKKPNEEEP